MRPNFEAYFLGNIPAKYGQTSYGTNVPPLRWIHKLTLTIGILRNDPMFRVQLFSIW